MNHGVGNSRVHDATLTLSWERAIETIGTRSEMAQLSSSELANWDGRYTQTRHHQGSQHHDRNEQSSVPRYEPMSTCTDTKFVTRPAAVANLGQRGADSRRIDPEGQQVRVVDRNLDGWWLTFFFRHAA